MSSTTRRTLRHRLAAGMCAALAIGAPLLLAEPAAAVQKAPAVLYSTDGVTFSPSPQGSVFAAGETLIPGASTVSALWVRNMSGAPAHLAVALADANATTGAFLDSLSLTAATGSGEGIPVALGGSVCAPLLSGDVLADGATVRIRFRLSLSADAGNAGQGSTAGARLAVSLSDAAAPAVGVDCGGATTVALLPRAVPAPGGATTEGALPAAAGQPQEDSVRLLADSGAAPRSDGAPALPGGERSALVPVVVGAAVVLAAAVAIRRRRRAHD